MRNAIVLTALVSFTWAHAKELLANRITDAQDSMDQHAKDKLVGGLMNRARKVSPLRYAGLDNTALRKVGATPSSSTITTTTTTLTTTSTSSPPPPSSTTLPPFSSASCIMSIVAAALIGVCIGSAVAYAVFWFRLGASKAKDEPLSRSDWI